MRVTHLSSAHAIAVLLVVSSSGVAEATEREPISCAITAGERVEVAGVNDRLELDLADGRVIRIVGLDPSRPTRQRPELARQSRDAMAAWLEGHDVVIRPITGATDRWGRIAADVEASAIYDQGEPDDPVAVMPVSVGEAAVDSGWARFRPEPSAERCALLYRQTEQTARTASLGLWADPYYEVLRPGLAPDFVARAASMALVEGPVMSVGEGRSRLYLNFERTSGRGFSVTIAKRSLALLEKAGLRPREWTGAILRVRGMIDTRFGPHLDLTRADQIEILARPQSTGSP